MACYCETLHSTDSLASNVVYLMVICPNIAFTVHTMRRFTFASCFPNYAVVLNITRLFSCTVFYGLHHPYLCLLDADPLYPLVYWYAVSNATSRPESLLLILHLTQSLLKIPTPIPATTRGLCHWRASAAKSWPSSLNHLLLVLTRACTTLRSLRSPYIFNVYCRPCFRLDNSLPFSIKGGGARLNVKFMPLAGPKTLRRAPLVIYN